MSEILLASAKSFLNVIHAQDDTKLQLLLDAAESEALAFMNHDSLDELCVVASSEVGVVSSSEQPLPADIVLAVFMLLQASYEASPDEAVKLRALAEVKLMPYRCGLGV